MRLFLIRHGDYIHESEDGAQPLSAVGIQQIEAISTRYLGALSLDVKELWSSPKNRALQSARIVRSIVCPDVEIYQRNDLTPNADPRGVSRDLGSLTGDVIIVSHLPFIPALIEELTKNGGGVFKILTGVTVCLMRQGEGSAWQITEVASPDDYMS